MVQRLPKHGTQAGYDAERKTDNICERCRVAHRVYNRQFSKTYKAKSGKKLGAHDVIDHLDTTGTARVGQGRPGTGQGEPTPKQPVSQPGDEDTPTPGLGELGPERDAQSQDGPSLADRLRSAMGRMGGESYVQTEGMPDYLRVNDDVKPDPEPEGGDWPKVDTGETYVMTEQTLSIIEGNLATYLSVVGITVEMID